MTAHKDNAVNMTTSMGTTPTSSTEQPGFFSRIGGGLIRFLREVTAEMKKTTWPTRNELTKFTIVVMITIIVVAIFLFISDTIVGLITSRLFGITSSGSGP